MWWEPWWVYPLLLSALCSHITFRFCVTHYTQVVVCKCPLFSCISVQLMCCLMFVSLSCALTIAGNERPVVSAVRVQLAAFGRSFAGRSLHEELVFAEGALLCAIQWLALRLERTPGLLSVSLPFTRNERGAVFGFSGRESPERVRLVIPTLRSRSAIIWIHRCHIAVWDARCVHT